AAVPARVPRPMAGIGWDKVAVGSAVPSSIMDYASFVVICPVQGMMTDSIILRVTEIPAAEARRAAIRSRRIPESRTGGIRLKSGKRSQAWQGAEPRVPAADDATPAPAAGDVVRAPGRARPATAAAATWTGTA